MLDGEGLEILLPPLVGLRAAVRLGPFEEFVDDLDHQAGLAVEGDGDLALLGRPRHQLVVEPVGLRLVGVEAVLLLPDLDVEAVPVCSRQNGCGFRFHGAKNPRESARDLVHRHSGGILGST